MAMTMYPGAFCAFPKLGGRVEPAHTPAPQFKTYCASAMNTQLSNLKAVLILMEEPPCHIPSPEHPAGSRIMTLSRDSLPMCWLITWPWPNWIWAVRVARPGLKPGAFSTSSFWPSSPRSLSEWAKGSMVHPPCRAQIKALLFQGAFHHPSQLLLIFAGLGSTVTSFREAFPDHKQNMASLPQLLERHPVYLLPRAYHNLNSGWLCMCIGFFSLLPPGTMRSPKRVTSQPPCPVVCGKCNARDTAGN